jgi:antitoxin MazE
MAARRLTLRLKVARWGKSLAVRLPAEASRRIGVEDGDTLIARVAEDGQLLLTAQTRSIEPEEARRLRRSIERQRQTSPVVGEMRHRARL